QRAAHLFQTLPTLQFLHGGNGVDRLAPRVDRQDRLVDALVSRTIEVVGLDDLDYCGDGVAGQHHRAENRLLRLEVVRWHAFGPRGAPEVLNGPYHSSPFSPTAHPTG